jgi:O-antigen ligase
MGRSSHNSYLSFLAEGGLVGALPLAALIVTLAIRGALAAMALNRKGERWALGVYASFIAMSVHFWVLSGLAGTHAWFVYGLVVASVVSAKGRLELPRPSAQLRRDLRQKWSRWRGPGRRADSKACYEHNGPAEVFSDV